MISGNVCRPECGEDKRGRWGLRWVRVHECRQREPGLGWLGALAKLSSAVLTHVSSSRASIRASIQMCYHWNIFSSPVIGSNCKALQCSISQSSYLKWKQVCREGHLMARGKVTSVVGTTSPILQITREVSLRVGTGMDLEIIYP